MAIPDITAILAVRTPSDLADLVAGECDGDHQQVVSAVNRHINTLLGASIVRARESLRKVTPVLRMMPPQYRPHLLAMEARVAHYGGDHRTALAKYLQADRGHRKRRNHEAAARLGQGLMDVYKVLGQYDRAIAVGKRSLAYFRRHGMNESAGRVLTNIGNIYHHMDRNRLALKYYDKSREVFLPMGGLFMATTEFCRANIYANLNDLKTAEELYAEAGRIWAEKGMDLLHAKARYGIAYLRFLADRHTEALRLLEESRAEFERLGDPPTVVIACLDLIELNIHLNQFGTAIILGVEAGEQAHGLGARYEQARAEYFMSLARLHLGDADLAAESLRTAGRLFRQEGNALWSGMVLLARSRLQMQTGKMGAALRSATEAKRLFAASGDYRRCTDAEIVHLEVLARSRGKQAAPAQARRILKRNLVSYQSYAVHTVLGTIYLERREYEPALAEYRRAVDVVEKMLGGLYPDEVRFFFVADKLAAYTGMVQCLLELGRPDESFLTNLRALETLNRRQVESENIEQRMPPALLAERERLRAALRRMERFPGDSGSRSSESVERLSSTEQRLWSTEQRIRAHLYPERKKAASAPLEGARHLLEVNELLVSFVAPERGAVGAFCATRERLTYVPLGIDREELRRRVWELYYVLEKAVMTGQRDDRAADATAYYLTGLHEVLAAPVLRTDERERVLLLTDGIFAQVPYAILQNSDGEALWRQHDLRVIVNPADMAASPRPAVTFAERQNSVFAVLSERLPAVEQEARGICRIFDRAALHIDSDATAERFKAELKRSDGFIHLATHASRSSENPLFSRIMLSDGPFFPFDLFATGIRAELVALSGCQTAASGLYYGHSFSLARAFYQAGSRFVLASLWPVSDRVSEAFMRQFYEHLKESNDVPQAYRAAMAATAEAVGNPAFWGAFVLLGM